MNERNIAMLSIAERVERRLLQDQEFALITDDCWGDRTAAVLGRPYNSPFVAVYFYPECYLTLLENLSDYLQRDLTYDHTSKYIDGPTTYPVARFQNDSKGVEIHCYHYADPAEARAKWMRRRERFLTETEQGTPLFVKFANHDLDCERHLRRFHALPFENKVSFSRFPFDHPDHVHTPHVYRKREDRPYNGLAYFRRRYRCFDFADWILSHQPRHTWRSRMLAPVSF